MTELEVRARAAGASGLAVLSAADNDAAVALYRAMGFQEFSVALQKWRPKIGPIERAESSRPIQECCCLANW
jgi:ribosomal protein S18 acetylase RimI-like enzyme